MPFDKYDYSDSAASYMNGGNACPSVSDSVRSCYQGILANFRQQGATGVRFMFGFCGGAYSTPLQNCGQSWQHVTGPVPNGVWINNVNAFLFDVKKAGIYNITVTPAHGDFIGVYGVNGGAVASFQAPQGPPHGQMCDRGLQVLMFQPAAPYGTVPCSNTPPYYCTKQNCKVSDCQPNATYPAGYGNQAYNCSSSNPIFAGWTNIDNVIGAVLGAARANGLTVVELDVEQEFDPANFTETARYVLDDAETQTGNPDSVNVLRGLMTANTYDPGRVVWSGAASNVTVAGTNCTSVYTDYARISVLDEIASAIGAGWIGNAYGGVPTNGLLCGGSVNGPGGAFMFQMPGGHSQPDIWDLHAYPCVKPASGGCYTNESQAQVRSEATMTFNDVPHFFTLVNTPAAYFMVGETHSNTNNGSGASCEGAPTDSAWETVAGYNAAANIAGKFSVTFRPWFNFMGATSTCDNYPANQEVNAGNAGPYTPTQE